MGDASQVHAHDIVEGDCRTVMPGLPDGSFQCIFLDPPYNLQLQGELSRPDGSAVHGVTADWDRFASFADYDRFTRAWATEARRLLADDGTLWAIGTYHNIFRVGAILQDLGFWILNDVVWLKTNPMPNFRGTRFTNAHETLIWAAKSPEARPRFHYRAMKAANEDVQMRSDWLLPVCTGAERLRVDGRKAHPTQKPEALLHRVLTASTSPGDRVLDPFAGTGTTGAVARRLGRRFLGIERDPAHARLARARVAAAQPLPPEDLEPTPEPRAQPRIPFGALVEQGLVSPGATLWCPARRGRARVRADGSLAMGGRRGSIHQIGAAATGQASCNGWTYWHVEDSGRLVPIDAMRARLRARWSSAPVDV